MKVPFAAVLLALAAAASAQAQPGGAARGQLLYDNHCGACHGTQMHWRDKKLVTDWASLKAEVRRWQAAAHLGWGNDEIDDVARHLNQLHYRFTPAGQRVSRATAGSPP